MNDHGKNRRPECVAPSFDVRELDYELPEALIAQTPLPERSASRMLVLDRAQGTLRDGWVRDFPSYVTDRDAVVLNDTRVLPAKFTLVRRSGGRIAGLFLEEHAGGEWEVLLQGAGRFAVGEALAFDVSDSSAPAEARPVHEDLSNAEGGACGPVESDEARAWTVRSIARGERGRWRVQVNSGLSAAATLSRVGRMPLPPYIKRDKGHDGRDTEDAARYQTVYAANDGAVAAPTAGLHFTPALLEQLEARGALLERVTLHVGYGTFAPLEVDDLANHPMHAEYAVMEASVGARLNAVRQHGGRVIAVGTTSARVLETAWRNTSWLAASRGWTNLFCYPPYVFGGVDALLTNFHLPRSTLLALVMAFAGRERIREAYAHAIESNYRFFSYGDAMLIL